MNSNIRDLNNHPGAAQQRKRICNLENAGAVATQITENTGRPTVIVDTKEAIQPYRVEFLDEFDPRSQVVAEIHMAA